MIFNMHCRPSCPTNNSNYSSFISAHLNHTNTLNHRTCSPSSKHDQISAPRRRRRRLEDPVINHASNYYATNPHRTSPSLQTRSLPSPNRIDEKSEDRNIYCDLFNLLERPSPVMKKKKYISNNSNSCCTHWSIIYKNIHTKIKDIDPPRQQQSSYYKEKKCIYQRYESSKGFFRRIIRNYFCTPMTVTNEEFSN